MNLLNIFFDSYFKLENQLVDLIRNIKFLDAYTSDITSARITLFLLIMGGFALVNEIYISIQMSSMQMDAWEELNNSKLDEDFIRNHKFLRDDSYHAREWMDEKSGIIVEEFESREKFFEKPVHVAHIHVKCQIFSHETKTNLLRKPITFHIEFSPEEFENERRPEFGCTLKVLRTKLYHLFKDGALYNDFILSKDKKFKISENVRIYNNMNECLGTNLDDIQLCFLKMETGDTIACEFLA